MYTCKDAINLLLAVQAPGDARIVPVRRLPTQPLGHVLGELVMELAHRPPPATDTASAIKARARRIKTSAYVGISVTKADLKDIQCDVDHSPLLWYNNKLWQQQPHKIP